MIFMINRVQAPLSWLVRVRQGPISLFALLIGFALIGVGCDSIGGEDDTTAPSAPSALVAESGKAQVELEWQGVAADDLVGFNVYRDTSPIEGLEGRDPVNAEVVPDTLYTDEAVENGTVYYYRITAVDEADNESDPSGSASVRPFAEPPTRPE